MSEVVLPRRRVRGCCGIVEMPALTAAEVDVSYVRRAVLPWRRRVTPSAADRLGDALLGRHTTGPRRVAHALLRLLGLVVALLLVPVALLELLVALAVWPVVAWQRRRSGQWPVQLVTGGQVRHVEKCPSPDAAKERAFQMRMELIHLEPYEEIDDEALEPVAGA